jgi:MFS family permease
MSETALKSPADNRPWWSHLNGYHWFVFIMAVLGWLFDTMDGQIFLASRSIAIKSLLPEAEWVNVDTYGTYVTSMFILGWAIGGLLFGSLGDRWGRAKTMGLTILVYALFTGASALSRNWWEFGFYRFLTGMGVGGEFAAGASLVAEAMPEKARAKALGLLQALSAVGNVMGAGIFWYVESRYGWKVLYMVGAFPALIAVVAFLKLREPEKWLKAREAAKTAEAEGRTGQGFGSISDLLSVQWRRNTLVGLMLGIAGVLGLWGVGFFSPELMDASFPVIETEHMPLIRAVVNAEAPDAFKTAMANLEEKSKDPAFKEIKTKYKNLLSTNWHGPSFKFDAEKAFDTPLNKEQAERVNALLAKAVDKKTMTGLKGKGLILQQIGAFIGILMFSFCATRWGRRPAFLFSFLIAWAAVWTTFYTFHSQEQVYYLFPLLGFGTLAPFGGYAIYFPELFPTRLRNTGTSFCYNVGRFVAALGPTALGTLKNAWRGQFEVQGFRLAALVVSSAYIIGIVALVWAPETKDQALPEDEKGVAH